jgi:hypothetical protein
MKSRAEVFRENQRACGMKIDVVEGNRTGSRAPEHICVASKTCNRGVRVLAYRRPICQQMPVIGPAVTLCSVNLWMNTGPGNSLGTVNKMHIFVYISSYYTGGKVNEATTTCHLHRVHHDVPQQHQLAFPFKSNIWGIRMSVSE